jgi:hypothetical protein
MPTSILSSLLAKPSLSIINSQTGLDVATNLNVSKVRFKFRSRVFRHKREDGTTIVDARVLVPSICEIDVLCETLDDLALVNSLMLDRTGVYRVTSKGLVVTNMMCAGESISQTPDVISANPVRIVMEKLLTQDAAEPPAVAQAADSSMLDQGIQAIQNTVSQTVTTAQQLASQVIANLGL